MPGFTCAEWARPTCSESGSSDPLRKRRAWPPSLRRRPTARPSTKPSCESASGTHWRPRRVVRGRARKSAPPYLQPPRSGDKEHQCGDNQANDQGGGNHLGRLAPDDPRCGAGEQEDGGNRAGQQRAEVHTKPEPACLLQAPTGWFSPVVRDQTWGPPEVGADMDGNHREPDQDAEIMHGEEWASLRRAGHHESDPAADHHEGRDDEQRRQHPQRQAGRASAHEGGCCRA